VPTIGGKPAAQNQFVHASRRAWYERLLAKLQTAARHRMETIDIFLRRYRFDDDAL
jgi:hypothetical protein